MTPLDLASASSSTASQEGYACFTVIPAVQDLIQEKARSVTRHPLFNQSDHDDVVQELSVEIERVADRFTVGPVPREHQIRHVLKQKSASIVRRRRAAKRDPRRSRTSLDAASDPSDNSSPTLAATLDESQARAHLAVRIREPGEARQLHDDVHVVLDQLSDSDRELCNLIMTGSISSAARALNRCRQSVYRDLERLKRVCSGHDLDGYL